MLPIHLCVGISTCGTCSVRAHVLVALGGTQDGRMLGSMDPSHPSIHPVVLRGPTWCCVVPLGTHYAPTGPHSTTTSVCSTQGVWYEYPQSLDTPTEVCIHPMGLCGWCVVPVGTYYTSHRPSTGCIHHTVDTWYRSTPRGPCGWCVVPVGTYYTSYWPSMWYYVLLRPTGGM